MWHHYPQERPDIRLHPAHEGLVVSAWPTINEVVVGAITINDGGIMTVIDTRGEPAPLEWWWQPELASFLPATFWHKKNDERPLIVGHIKERGFFLGRAVTVDGWVHLLSKGSPLLSIESFQYIPAANNDMQQHLPQGA